VRDTTKKLKGSEESKNHTTEEEESREATHNT
jgi:hypothetical protein